ncbi:MerR family transcriptional regulator [Streptomyces sp. NPDC004726]
MTQTTPREGWSIGALAARAGLPVKTVRYYSGIGLLPVAGRSPGGHRRYAPDALARLRTIQWLRALDLRIAVVSTVLSGEVTLDEVAVREQGRIREAVCELAWRDAVWQALRESTGGERRRRMALLARVRRPREAHDELARSLRQRLCPSLPGRLADLIVSRAAPPPPARPSARAVLAYGELHALAVRLPRWIPPTAAEAPDPERPDRAPGAGGTPSASAAPRTEGSVCGYPVEEAVTPLPMDIPLVLSRCYWERVATVTGCDETSPSVNPPR